MRISHLSLTNFRNYSRLELSMPPKPVVLHGNNAQGKTSLLEAIYYLATSRSPYTTSDRDLINWLAEDEPLPFARLVAEVHTASEIKRVEVTLLRETANRETRLKKEIRVNGLPRRVMDLLGHIRVVMFLPQDMSLIEGPPGGRRRYLDITLCQTDQEYCQALRQYDKVLLQRNALLRQFQERGGRGDLAQLDFWDDQLAASAAIIVTGRYHLVRELERRAQDLHRDLSGGEEHLRLRYQPGFDAVEAPEGQMRFETADLGVSALPQLTVKQIAGRFKERLHATRREDARRGQTGIGPQRDEMRFVANGHDLGSFGSRGQNRTAVLALKLAELDWMRETTGEWPVLLLDEVAAELDPLRRSYLMARIRGAEQVLLTTTELSLLDPAFLEQASRWEVEAGHITQVTE